MQTLLVLAIAFTRHEPIRFDQFINDISITARKSSISKQNIFKTYKRVFGPIEEMNGMDIGELIVEFDWTQHVIDITKYMDGKRYLRLELTYPRQSAEIQTLERIPDGMSGTQLMTFTNSLLSNLRIRTAVLIDGSRIFYEGCDGKKRKFY